MTHQSQNSNDLRPRKQKMLLRLFSGDGAALHRLYQRSLLTLCFERLWPLILPLILLAALFASLSWFGLFGLMPRWFHIAVLTLFGLATIAALYLLSLYNTPSDEEVTAHIETVNGLLHEPLAVQSGQIATGADDPVALALWQEHQHRMAARLKALQSGLPRPNIPQRDPYGLCAFIALLFVTAFAFSFGPSSGRIADAFHIRPGHMTAIARIDAWVTPPEYTARAPIFLSADRSSTTADPIIIPQGSIVSVRIIGGNSERLTATDASGHRSDIKPVKTGENDAFPSDQAVVDGSRNFQLELQQDTTLELSGTNTGWRFSIIPDKAPRIHFTKEPGRALNGALQLSYEINDDYGATKAFGEIIPLETDEEDEVSALYDAPELPLSLPARGSKTVTTSKDLTEHPWSGGKVALTLVAVDAAGNTGRSETKIITLPERPFSNPLARAVVEQRRILALDATQRAYVLDMLSAVLLRPEDTIKNAAHYLGLSTIRSRLRLANSDEELRQTADYMWQVALGIEDGNLSAAEKRLRQAQEALREALQKGASQEEIERLSAELREAMQNFLREFAQRQQQNPNARMPADPNMQVMTDKDLQRMLDQIENLARQGSRDQAEQLLSQLQNMLNNLQMGQQAQPGQQGQGQGQGQAGQMQQQMNRLGDLMRKQQQLMNDTFKLDQQMQQQFGFNAEEFDEDFFHGEDGTSKESRPQNDPSDDTIPPHMAETMRKLQQQQSDLQSELEKLGDDLRAMGIDPNKDFSDAGRSMGSAADSLGQNETSQAGDHQGNALESLRRGGRDMMQQMQQAMGQGLGQRQGSGRQGGRDPLGRKPGSSGPDFGDDVKIPGEIDIQRAREILDEIRRRLGDAITPQMEKEYLERLLKFD